MDYLNINQIKNIPDVPEKEIEIPEWNTKILVKGLSKSTQVKLARIATDETADAFDYQKALLKASCVKPELDDEAIELLYQKDAQIVDKIFEEIAKINGLSEEVQSALAEEFQD